MENKRFIKQLSFIIEADKLKEVYRKSLLMDASRNENDAEHSWHLALAVIILSEYSNDKKIDILKVLKMAIIHDIVEIYAGDTFAYSGNYHSPEKYEREKKALDQILSLLPEDQKKEFTFIWDEFEENSTAEANFAKALDRFMPILHNYQTEGIQWKKYNVKKDMVLDINKHIEKGSTFLWEYVQELVDDSGKKEYLSK